MTETLEKCPKCGSPKTKEVPPTDEICVNHSKCTVCWHEWSPEVTITPLETVKTVDLTGDGPMKGILEAFEPHLEIGTIIGPTNIRREGIPEAIWRRPLKQCLNCNAFNRMEVIFCRHCGERYSEGVSYSQLGSEALKFVDTPHFPQGFNVVASLKIIEETRLFEKINDFFQAYAEESPLWKLLHREEPQEGWIEQSVKRLRKEGHLK